MSALALDTVLRPIRSARVIATVLAGALLARAGLATAGPAPAAHPSRDNERHSVEGEQQGLDADADADTYAGPAPLTVRFSARALDATGRVTYAWDFDDGSRSSEQNPVHTFRKRGWYLVTMDARDGTGRTERVNLQLHAWRPRDWTRFQATRDMRIVEHAVQELERKRARAADAKAAGRATP